jgi:hypothetical protein
MKNDDGLRLWDRTHKEGEPFYWNLHVRGTEDRYEGPYVLRTLPPVNDFVFVSVRAAADRVTIVPYDVVTSFQLGPERDEKQRWFRPDPGT